MTDERTIDLTPYDGPAGGWGSMKSVTEINLREKVPLETARELYRQNKPEGFMCVSCAWGKPAKPLNARSSPGNGHGSRCRRRPSRSAGAGYRCVRRCPR